MNTVKTGHGVRPHKQAPKRGRTHPTQRPRVHGAKKEGTSMRTQSHDGLTFVPLGGLEEIGRNMSVFEYKNEIIIVDMGLQFPEEDTPGIDYIIPNIEGLMEKRSNIKGIIITHGHYDHIGAIPYLIDKLGANIPIYAADLSKEIIKRRQEDFTSSGELKLISVKNGDKIKMSEHIEVEFFEITHTIPDSLALVIKTPVGNMAYCTDLKITYDIDGVADPREIKTYTDIGSRGIHTLFLESTGADRAGQSISEELVEQNIDALVAGAKDRIIIGLFASLLTRVSDIIRIAEKHGRKVFLSGFSLKTNVQIAQNLGYIKPKKGTILPIEELHKYKDDKVLILSTGAQGEPNASLMKIVNGIHRQVTIKKGDTIVFSSSVIPGNERPIQTLKDNLTRQGAHVYQTEHLDVHSGGHGPAEDLKTVIGLVAPKFFLPIHGWYFMRSANVRLAAQMGVPEENSLLVDNGQVVHITPQGLTLTKETLPAYYIMVDGLGVGDVEEIVLRDRVALSQEGMIVVFVTLDRRTGSLIKNPDIISRGFIHLRDNKDLIEDMRTKVKKIIGRIPHVHSVESDYLKALLRDQLGSFVYNKTKRRPMILPAIIKV